MANPTLRIFQNFSASELKSITGWSDNVINDYLNILPTFENIDISTEEIINRLDIVESAIGTINLEILQINSAIATINSDIDIINSSITTINTNIENISSSVSTIQFDINIINSAIGTLQTCCESVSSAVGTLQFNVAIINEKIGNTGENDPVTEGLPIIEGSVYYRRYISGSTLIKESWAVVSGEWTQLSIYLEAYP